MATSLFIEHHANGLAFYINGDLQFDTADEALYHEYLVIPTVSLALQRFPENDLRVLICGGGDGLAARDVLRFSQVSHIDLVDCNPEVLELGTTAFKPYNAGSLENERVTVYTQEALEFVSTVADNSYHAIICDFTYPTCPEDTTIYSREWFQQINRVLMPGGTISTNGVSPENRSNGFWCLYQTLLSAGLKAKPLQLEIPSFHRHGYGNWGFFLGSQAQILRSEIEVIVFPEDLQTLTHEKLFQTFVFSDEITRSRHDVTIHTLECPQLFYYLLNPSFELGEKENAGTTVDFLEIQESGTAILGSRDLLKLESMAQAWLEQMYESSASPDAQPNITKLLPVQHRYHSPKMTREGLAYLRHLLGEIDLSRLLNTLLERSQELPPKIAGELKQLAEKIRAGQPIVNLPPKTAEFLMMLSVTLLMANLLTPDAVFAKGYSSGTSSGYSSGTSVYYTDGYINWELKILGLVMIGIGGGWLYNIFNPSDSNNDE